MSRIQKLSFLISIIVCCQCKPPSLQTAVTAKYDLERREYVCLKSINKIVIDGKLDDPSWSFTPWSIAFVDITGDPSKSPRFETRVKMLWNDQYLYIAAFLEEPHIWAYNKKPNSYIYQFENNFEVFIDPDRDHHNYYELEMNAINTIWELSLPRPYRDGGNPVDPDNMQGLQSAISYAGSLNDPSDFDKGWYIEIAFPWAGFKKYDTPTIPPKHGDNWRVNFSRVQWEHEIVNGQYIQLKEKGEENWCWSPQGKINMHMPERWGELYFAEEVKKDLNKSTNFNQIRDQMMELYYKEKEYKSKNGLFTSSLKLLNFDPTFAENVDSYKLIADSSNFHFWVSLKTKDKILNRLVLDDTSRIILE